jgi:hypothetical protein
MTVECFRTKTGIRFLPDALEALELDPDIRRGLQGRPPQRPLGTGVMGSPVDTSAVRVNDSPTLAEVPAFTTRDEEERADALSPMHG